MKIFVYSHRPDETQYFEKFSKQYGAEVTLTSEAPNLDNAHLASGYSCISIITTKIDAKLMQRFFDIGVRLISTRTVGYEHIDLDSAKKLGIGVGNVSYSPSSVAEYTVMLMLMTLRKINLILQRSQMQNFSLGGIQGRELRNMTIGVIGTGRIGKTVIQNLCGFGCRILAYDPYPNDSISCCAEYVSFDELISQSDIITLHVPGAKDNRCLISREVISQMKNGVVIINTARGSLIDTQALIDAIENGKIGAAGLDVIEREADLYYHDLTGKVLKHRDLSILQSFPNVIVTPHTAFYTDQAVSDMVEYSLLSCIEFLKKAD
jgi:D-lactate dehydrogenase